MQQRGIIMAPPITVNNSGFSSGTVDLKQHLRMALFFWDKIDLPDNNLFSINYSNESDVNFLTSCNILESTNVMVSGGGIANKDMFLKIQETVFEHRNKQNSKCLWSLQHLHEELIFNGSKRNTLQRTIEFELYNAIPIPKRTVPLEDILEFKQKYYDELISFRMCMDDMYLEIINSPDQLFAKNAKLLRLEKSIADLHKSMESRSLRKSIISQKIILKKDFTDLLGGGVQAYGYSEIMQQLGVHPILSTLLGVTGAFLKFGLKENNILSNVPDDLKDYAYIARIEKEFNTR